MNDLEMTADDFIESLYLLILLLIVWGLSFAIGIALSSDSIMVGFFWLTSFLAIISYALICKKNGKNLSIIKRELILLIPIWLFLIYQSYITLKQVQMTSEERWALIPFVIGLGFYVTFLKRTLDKKRSDK